jgi:Autotransporter beta-domain/IPT/TIG domain
LAAQTTEAGSTARLVGALDTHGGHPRRGHVILINEGWPDLGGIALVARRIRVMFIQFGFPMPSSAFSSPRRRKARPRRWLAILLTVMVACLAPSLAAAQSCVAGSPIGAFPFTPGVDNPFRPGDSRVTQAAFNGVAGDVLSFQARPGGANSQIQLVRASDNAAIIATIIFNASGSYTITAADVAQFPYQMRIANNSTVNQEYTIGCAAAPPPAAPSVTAINPASGSTAGGTAVTITGANFTGATAVTIGGVAAPFTVVNATTINATTAAHAAGVVNVVVTTPNGSGAGTGLFTYVAPPAAPTVTAINPTSGPIGGGTAVTITGTNFTGATAVTIGGVPATGVSVVNATTITANTGAHAAGAVDVVVTTPNGVGAGSGLFTYVAPPTAPTITAVSPPRGVTGGGTAVTITGTDFTGARSVTIGGVAAPFTVASATSITATTGAHAAGVADVVVTTPNGTGTGIGLFTYVAPAAPTVAAITPASGATAGGTAVTITGTTLIGATSVTIGGVAATFTVVNPTTITATTGPHAAGAVDVVVTTPGGTGAGAGLFTYVEPQAAPAVAAIAPASGPSDGGTVVTITGANFTGASGVSIGGVPVTFTLVSATAINATTAAHAAGAVDVVVTTPNGTGTGSGLFTYVAPAAPSVTAIAPATGATAGGTAVTITGTSFIGATSITIGGVAAPFAVVNATTITATTGPHAAGVVDVVVTTPGGTGTGAGLFTYVAPPAAPVVASVSPASGSTEGGVQISIAGANFTGATAVSIGGVAAANVTVVSDTNITATTGPHAAGVTDIVVTTPNGTGAGSGLYTYVAPQITPTKAIETIGAFLGRRNMLIASSEPASNREIDRLMQAAGGARSSNIASGAAPLSGRGGPVASLPFASSDVAIGGPRQADRDIGPPRRAAAMGDMRNWQFSTSLSEVARHAAVRSAAPGFGVRDSGAGANPFDVWLEGTYASFGDRRLGTDLDGHFGMLSLGADYVVNSRLLLGAMAQFDTMSESSDIDAIDIEGQGWMVGPYATLRLGDNLFWRVRAAWGQSSNEVRPLLTYTDHFDSDRWLVSSRLTGNMEAGRWTFRPSASVLYMEDVAQSYVDGAGATIPEIRARLGQIEAGPEVSYRYEMGDLQFEPRAALNITATFANEANAQGFGQIDSTLVGPDGMRARAELGLRATTRSGLALDLSGAYDGIGADHHEAYSARLSVRVPLN